MVVGLVVLGLMGARSAGAFDPTKYVGAWTGTWKNKTFKVEGPMLATVTGDATTLTVDWNVAGLFNCGGAAAVRTLVSGTDFTAEGLNFTATNAAWGDGVVTSQTKKKVEKLSVSGTTPCNAGIESWSVKAKLKDDKLKGKMKIVFLSGSPKRARTTFLVTKAPLQQ
jgi:hypothetical protein